MKQKKVKNQAKSKTSKFITLAAVAVAAFALAAWGVTALFSHLHEMCNRQCIVTNCGEQVEIIPGKIIPIGSYVSHFGLTNGVNLADVDFQALRLRILKDFHMLRDIKITRRMPNHVRIEAVERIPAVRICGSGAKSSPNLVADRDGVVFWYPRRETMLLPIVRETNKKATPAGERLSGAALAALKLLEESADPRYSILKIQEVDTFKPDYLFATLGDSSRAKIAWEGMLNPTTTSRISLTNQLYRLAKAIASNVAAGTKLWNATDWGTPGRVYANDPSKAE
jgi:hypothetical protein